MTSMIDIALVDDHTLVREGLCQMLDSEDDLQVVGQADNLARGRALVNTSSFDVLIVDVTLPDGSGLALAADARERSARLGIVVLTMHGDDETLLQSLDVGASAFLHKTAGFHEIASAVRRAAVFPEVFAAAGLVAALRRRDAGDRPRLTPRETEVMSLLGQGYSVSQVARTLFVSQSTVKTHIAKLYDKLGATNRTQAVMAAMRHGLLDVSG